MVDFEKSFFNYIQYEKRLSENTLIAYRADILQFQSYILEEFQETDLLKVNHNMVRTWMIHLLEKKDSSTTVNRKISCLKSFYKFLLKNDHIQSNPTTKVIRPKIPTRLPKDVKQNSLKDLLDVVEIEMEESDFEKSRDGLMFMVLYTCGIRRSELINLTWSQIDFNRRQLLIMGKGKKQRIVPLLPEVLEFINKYKAVLKSEGIESKNDEVFVLDSGKPLYPNFVYRKLKELLTQISTQKGLGPHTLRHSFATHMLNQGADLNVIKELLGHSSLAATQVYTHNSIEKLKEIHKFSHPKS